MTRPRVWTEALIERRQLEGCGSGSGASYKPWFGVRDFSSLGRVRRAFSPKLGRTVELVSDVEWRTFLALEWDKGIIDINEQWPLDRRITLGVAPAIGASHPYYPGTRVPVVMTVDFLITRIHQGKKYQEAIDCKRTEEAENERSLEKLEIARTYFAGRDVAHRLVFSSTLPLQKLKNIEWIRGGMLKTGEAEPYSGFLDEQANAMAWDLANSTRNQPLLEYCATFESRHALHLGDGLRIAKMLMFERVLDCDLSNPDLVNAPLTSFHCAARNAEQREIGD